MIDLLIINKIKGRVSKKQLKVEFYYVKLSFIYNVVKSMRNNFKFIEKNNTSNYNILKHFPMNKSNPISF